MKILLCWLLFVVAGICFGNEPDYVRVTIKAGDENQEDIITTAYYDSYGNEMQSHVYIPDNPSYNMLVTANKYNITRLPEKFYKITPVNLPKKFITADISIFADFYYNPAGGGGPDAQGYPYSEIKYYNEDPLGLQKENGAPGLNFSVDGHPMKYWYLSVPGGSFSHGSPSVQYLDSDGFIVPDQLTESNLINDVIVDALISSGVELNYSLTVTMDPNGHFSQNMTDKKGQLVRAWSHPCGLSVADKIVSKSTYDLLGRLIEEIPPATDLGSSTFEYNKMGQLIKIHTPDGGDISYEYDINGRLVKNVDAGMSINESMNFKYDIFGRDILAYHLEYIPAQSGYIKTVKMRTFYDLPEKAKKYLIKSAFGTTTEEVELFLDQNSFNNTRGKIVALIAYGEDCEGEFVTGLDDEINEEICNKKVIEMFSYNDEVRIEKKYLSVPGIPLQIAEYTYDLQGKILTKTITSATKIVTTRYEYNKRMFIDKIYVNEKLFVTYEYDVTGNLTRKIFGEGGNSKPITFNHNIREWITGINTISFHETIKYDDVGVTYPQYNGNISNIEIAQSAAGLPIRYPSIKCDYLYDNANRLIQVHNFMDDSSAENDDFFDAKISYDKATRLVYKYEGYRQGSPYDKYGIYKYKNGTCQLEYLEGSTTKDKVGNSPNYIYDSKGNMILDRSKKMAMYYDWRNLPVTFKFYDHIPEEVDEVSEVYALDANSDVKRLSFVKMLYNANGKRVLKQLFK